MRIKDFTYLGTSPMGIELRFKTRLQARQWVSLVDVMGAAPELSTSSKITGGHSVFLTRKWLDAIPKHTRNAIEKECNRQKQAGYTARVLSMSG